MQTVYPQVRESGGLQRVRCAWWLPSKEDRMERDASTFPWRAPWTWPQPVVKINTYSHKSCGQQGCLIWGDNDGTLPLGPACLPETRYPVCPGEKHDTGANARAFYKLSDQDSSKPSRPSNTKSEKSSQKEQPRETWQLMCWGTLNGMAGQTQELGQKLRKYERSMDFSQWWDVNIGSLFVANLPWEGKC